MIPRRGRVEDASVDLVINRMMFWAVYDPAKALIEWRRVLAPGGRIVVIDGLWHAKPTGLVQMAQTAYTRSFWAYKSWLLRPHRPRLRRIASDTLQPPGWSWQTIADAHAHFTQAGLHDAHARWLDTLFEVERRTRPLWKSPATPRLFVLTWQQPTSP